MIALVIGLIIVASVSQVFLSGKRSYGTQAGLGALQENGRFALYFLQRDLQFAGFPQRIGPSGSSLEVPTPFDTSRTLDGGTGSDEVTAWWNADADVEDSNLDCLGQETTTGPVWSRYFVEDAALSGEKLCSFAGQIGKAVFDVGFDGVFFQEFIEQLVDRGLGLLFDVPIF